MGHLPFGHAFHTSSFTLPTVISWSNDIVLRLPETSKKVSDTCGMSGTSASTPGSSCVLSTPATGFVSRAGSPSPSSALEGVSMSMFDRSTLV